jgi:small subunit ribosomal protein S16
VLMIRLARRGARKKPHNPRTNPASVELKRDRVEYWVSKGAQMSERVHKLFTKTPAPATAVSAA